MPIGSTYRVRTRGHQLGQRWETGVHIRWTTGSGGPEDLADSWTATIVPLMQAAVSQDVSFDEVVVTDTSESGDESFVRALTAPTVGALSGDILPGQNSIVLQLRTGQKGRRRHGRMYLPGVSELYQDNGQLNGAQLTAVTALGAGILNTYGPAGTETNYQLVIYSPPSPEYHPPKVPKVRTDTVITPVRSTVVDTIIRTQRRRSIGTGE